MKNDQFILLWFGQRVWKPAKNVEKVWNQLINLWLLYLDSILKMQQLCTGLYIHAYSICKHTHIFVKSR